jgi:hypothetical protein
MASWAAVLALSGFRYSAVEKSMSFTANEGTHFWSNGSAWGTCRITREEDKHKVDLEVLHGRLELKTFRLVERTAKIFKPFLCLEAGQKKEMLI